VAVEPVAAFVATEALEMGVAADTVIEASSQAAGGWNGARLGGHLFCFQRKQAPQGLQSLDATEQAAWLRIGVDIVEVRRGQTVPGVGEILAIEGRDGAWRLVVDNNPSASRESHPPALNRSAGATRSLEKKLIFGDGKH